MNRNEKIRARRAQVSRNRPVRSVGTNPGARPSTPVTGTGHVRRSRAVKMTGAQRDSTGRMSMWNDSTEFFTAPAWSDTVSTMPRGER